jgi:uncharacterized protein YutE (UPF0331/DUF86 family)
MSKSATAEADLLAGLLSQYEAEGFEVFIQPSSAMLPAFLKGQRPDAVAIKQDRKIAIELVRARGDSPGKVQQLRELFSGHPDWEVRVYYVAPRSPTGAIEIASRSSIDGAIQQVLELHAAGQVLAALLTGWATLEAAARALLPDLFERAQPTERLIEVLASEGYLTPKEADVLRKIGAARNAAVHGQLDVRIEPAQLDELLSVLRTLTKFLDHDAPLEN